MPDGTRVERVGDRSGQTDCDIVFVHGLDGDAQRTWQHVGGKEGEHWPRWVADDLRDAAVWTVGYEASALSWFGGAMPITERARNLLAILWAKGIGSRPVAFVAHSMGGLLVKQMLRVADSHGMPHYAPLAENTKLIVFVAVPHLGSAVASYADALRVLLRPSEATKGLRADDSLLVELNEWFRAFADRRRPTILSFYERKKTGRLGILVVPRASADFGYPGHDLIGDDKDHVTICKPADREAPVALVGGRHLAEYVAKSRSRTAPKTARLAFVRSTEIDLDCIPILLASEGPLEITYSEEVTRALAKLADYDRDPASYARGNKNFYSMTGRELERLASSLHTSVAGTLRSAEEAMRRNSEGLVELLKRLKPVAAQLPEHAEMSLRVFAALSALRLIAELKAMWDFDEQGWRNVEWFPSYEVRRGSICVFDLAPAASDTGRRVFGFRHYVEAEVGLEGHREGVMLPLDPTKELFVKRVEGHQGAYLNWILPQLARGSALSLDAFPQEKWRVLALKGQYGSWSSPDAPDPFARL